jgi:hypothetical protein
MVDCRNVQRGPPAFLSVTIHANPAKEIRNIRSLVDAVEAGG